MLSGDLAAAVVAVAAWRTAVAHSRIGRAAAYGRAGTRRASRGEADRLGVVVPLLAEQGRLRGLLAHFDALAETMPALELHLVTSEKEGRGPGSTWARCQAAARERPYVHHHHCHDADAIMAHQLNVVRDSEDGPEHLIFYNADSRPSAESVRFAGDVLAAAAGGGPRVCQQYGAYLANAHDLQGPASSVLLAAALWQTRWAQSFELPRALENLEPVRLDQLRRRRLAFGRGRLPRMNYVIGHGLALPRTFLAELGGFTTRWHNEDAVLGLQLALAGEPIVPNPHLEPADSPDNVRGLITQKSVWWTGPGLAPWYPERRSGNGVGRGGGASCPRPSWVAWMTAALTHHAICWLVGPTVLAASLVLAFTTPVPAVTAVAAIWVYVAWPNDTAARRLSDYGHARPSVGLRAKAALGAPFMYLLHGLSAWLGAARAVVRLFVPDLSKPKTPMRSS